MINITLKFQPYYYACSYCGKVDDYSHACLYIIYEDYLIGTTPIPEYVLTSAIEKY